MIYRLQQLAVVTFHKTTYLFFIALRLERVVDHNGVEVKDSLLNIGVYKGTELVVRGLPFLGANKCFLIDAPVDTDTDRDDAEEVFIMKCLWHQDFL